MSQSCLKFLKYALIMFNFIFWLCGGIILGLGIYLMMTSKYGSLLPSQPSLSVANTLIVLGTIVMVVSFLGCLGSLKENKCLLITFFILLLILMMIEIAVSIFLLIYEEKIDGFLLKEFGASLNKYTHSNITQGTQEWDVMQRELKCCGVTGKDDWNGTVPLSCCMELNCEKEKTYWKEGCYEKLKQWFEYNYLNVGIGVIVISIIQVLGMSFAMTLYCHVSKSGDSSH
ncbi:leukocyte surface antigen CD53-like [Polyodon spathula]|uniref:leukocyte surface antigen CD53-like n=1 Tax=Polyodon spathula TaxID=7913 RepID=UPI001B7F080E|nr:leukocyte surface antigen CD53-like [Polyodon spathula]